MSNREILQRRGWIPLLVAIAALGTGCRSYTAYMHLEPVPPATSQLDERERRRAVEIVEAVALDNGFIQNPRLVRLQRQASRSVESTFEIVSSFVPVRAMTGNRLSVSAVVFKSSGEFAVLIHDRDSGDASPIVGDLQRDLTRAFAERFAHRNIEIKRTRWLPSIGL